MLDSSHWLIDLIGPHLRWACLDRILVIELMMIIMTRRIQPFKFKWRKIGRIITDYIYAVLIMGYFS